MQTNPYATEIRILLVEGRPIETDQEGYIQNMDHWSTDFALALATQEGLALTEEHWEVIAFIRAYYEQHGTQATVRHMLKHFAPLWGEERGTNHHLHDLFPKGGPQKQGNRLAGLRRTKGEH